MLPEAHRQCYSNFRRDLEQSVDLATQPDLSLVELKTRVQTLQSHFEKQVMPLNSDDLEPTDEAQVRSLLVEINKQLRLLGMDSAFLQAARRSSTATQRQEQIVNRLQTLIRYCDALLQT